MLRLIIALSLITFLSSATSQNDIDYKHKSIFRALQKINQSENTDLKEIEIPDSIQENFRIHGKFFTSTDHNNNSFVNYVYIGRVKSCRAGGCGISRPLSANEDQEYFDYFILFDKEKNVKLVRVYNYQATHGQEVTSRGWLRQFIGYNGSDDLLVGKDIDAISGATISVYGITFDVQLKTEILKILL